MPPFPAELAIGNRLQADLLLLPYSLFDGPSLELKVSSFASVGEAVGPQETADLIGTERWLHPLDASIARA